MYAPHHNIIIVESGPACNTSSVHISENAVPNWQTWWSLSLHFTLFAKKWDGWTLLKGYIILLGIFFPVHQQGFLSCALIYSKHVQLFLNKCRC